jgi:predicted flavoprotein YhiN
MMDRALRHRPDAKWFVFIEAETYLNWADLLSYLSRFDASRELYLGKHMYIGDVLFAHWGSGFALSGPAIRKVSAHWRAHMAEYDQFTVENWAGDMVLGEFLSDVDVPLT